MLQRPAPLASNIFVSGCYSTFGGVNFIVESEIVGGKKCLTLPKFTTVSMVNSLRFFLRSTIQCPKDFNSFGMLSL